MTFELLIFDWDGTLMDSEYDLQMAANADMPALGVAYGVHGRERLLRHKPLDCLQRVTEIPACLERLAGENRSFSS